MIYCCYIKPVLDIWFSALLVLVLSPLLIILIILLSLFQHGQVFFIQDRVGLNERIFRILKFKTMRDLTNEHGELLPDAQRLTSIGRIVRRFSLDELPQLFNILKGEMSFVGPRPLLVDYLPLYSPVQRRRHDVKPGITGLAQVSGRNKSSWRERFEHDISYVQNCSFWLDVRILFRTFLKVLVAEGINAEGQATMERFKGD